MIPVADLGFVAWGRHAELKGCVKFTNLVNKL